MLKAVTTRTACARKKMVTQSGASTVYEYLWNESKLVGQKVGNDAVRILYDANDEPVGFTVNDSASYFYVKNLQGDVLAIVDKTGAEKVSYVYDAYGQIVSMTGDATLQKLNPCTYRGYYYDAETGLYYLQSRYYNPEWGRFINADKTEVLNITNNVKQANLYIYAENNPINYIDSSGDFGTPLQWAMAVIGGIAGWFFGDYVAKWFGYRSGWKYWSIRVGVVAGGAVIGWFAGSAIIRVATRYLSSNPQMLLKISSRFSPNILVKLLQILGYNPIGRMNKSFFIGFINSLFNKGKAVMPFSWVKAALDVARKYRLPIRIDNGHSGTSWNFIHLHIYKVHIRIPSNAIQYIRNYIKKWRL